MGNGPELVLWWVCREQAGVMEREGKWVSPDRSESVHAFRSGPRKTLRFCDLLDVPRCHVDGQG